MVSHHPTNKLISREPISLQKLKKPLSHTPHAESAEHPVLAPISERYPKEKGRLLTCYSPVRHSHHTTTKATQIPFDLHVLSTPPAFVLSQDQTLQTKNKKTIICSENNHPTTGQPIPTKKLKKQKQASTKQTHYRVHKQHPHTPTTPNKRPQTRDNHHKQHQPQTISTARATRKYSTNNRVDRQTDLR